MDISDYRAKLHELITELTTPASEEADAEAFARMKVLAPHAQMSDLIFWSEKIRTDDEIIDEVIRREAIWRSGGQEALEAHIAGQMIETLNNPEITDYRRYAAQMILEGMRGATGI